MKNKKLLYSVLLLGSVTFCYANAVAQKNINFKVDSATITKGSQVIQVTQETAPGFQNCEMNLKPNEKSKHITLTITINKDGKGTLTCQHT